MVTERHDDVLLLYINDPSVIVGRNQTIEAEADVRFCHERGIPIVRRLSGGGAVYHDRGNINYAFVSDKGDSMALDRDFTEPVISALRTLGVEATVGRRRELLAGGFKISGTASHVTRTRQLFHGTLLHRTDPEMLDRSLCGQRELRGKGVASVPGRVANIADLLGNNESTEAFLGRLGACLLNYYGLTGYALLSDAETAKIEAIERLRFSDMQP